MTLHDYARTGAELAHKYEHLSREPDRMPPTPRKRWSTATNTAVRLFVITGFGGIAFRLGAPKTGNEWGYGASSPRNSPFSRG
jgi:hypothetical protein